MFPPVIQSVITGDGATGSDGGTGDSSSSVDGTGDATGSEGGIGDSRGSGEGTGSNSGDSTLGPFWDS